MEVEGRVLGRKYSIVYAEFDYDDALRILRYRPTYVVSVKRVDDKAVLGIAVDGVYVLDTGDRVVVRLAVEAPEEYSVDVLNLPLPEITSIYSYYVDVKASMPGELKQYDFLDMFVLGIIYNVYRLADDPEITPFWAMVAEHLGKNYGRLVEVAGKLYPAFLEKLGEVDPGLPDRFDGAVRDAIRGVSSGVMEKNGNYYIMYMLNPSHALMVKTGDYADLLVTLWKGLIIWDNSGLAWLRKKVPLKDIVKEFTGGR